MCCHCDVSGMFTNVLDVSTLVLVPDWQTPSASFSCVAGLSCERHPPTGTISRNTAQAHNTDTLTQPSLPLSLMLLLHSAI